MSKKHSIIIFFLIQLLIILGFSPQYAFGQEKKDTIYINDESIETPLIYKSRDSIYINAITKQIHLFGDAFIEYEGITLKAGYILLDMEKNEITASYALNQAKEKIEFPEFNDGSEKMIASKLKINTTTKKVYIEEAKIKQSDMYLYLEKGKRQPNEELHFVKGRFTTCDLDEPHYHFQLSKAILIPEKKIITGPMNIWIKGIPTPLGLPFSAIPQKKQDKKQSGFLMPQIVPLSQYGFGFQDLGYYSPISDNLYTANYITLYNRGSFGIKNHTEYKKLYKYTGNFEISAMNFRQAFPNNTTYNNNIVLKWNHATDVKANPFWRFTSNVNFTSNNNSQQNLYLQNNPNYFTNQYNSDININRTFPSKPFSLSAKISFRQNTQTHAMTITSPVLTFNVNRFFPFKNVVKNNSNAFLQGIKQIGVIYSFDGRNLSTFGDSSLQHGDWKTIQQAFRNGFQQNAKIQTTFGLLKNKLKFTPSIDVTSSSNFQYTKLQYDNTQNIVVNQIKNGNINSYLLNFNASLSTTIYSYYRFIGKRKTLLRHILTPSLTWTYSPKVNETYTYLDASNQIITYRPTQYSAYDNYSYAKSNSLNFTFNNTFEVKQTSLKDSTGFRKIKVIEQLLIAGRYNYFADSMKLSDISINLRTSPIQAINFVSSLNLSPYNWNSSTGKVINEYAWNAKRGIGRITTIDFSTTYTFTSKASLDKLKNTKYNIPNNLAWDADLRYYALHQEQLINFDIPWKMNIQHNLSFRLYDTIYKAVHTARISGDVSFTKRWKLMGDFNFDVKTLKNINSSLTLTRDMHCWGLSFRWVPIGLNRSFQFRIFGNSGMIKSLQQSFTKPPFLF